MELIQQQRANTLRQVAVCVCGGGGGGVMRAVVARSSSTAAHQHLAADACNQLEGTTTCRTKGTAGHMHS
jgi:hypothetical protein